MAAVDGGSDPLLQECAEFTFKCVGCAAEQKFNHQRVNELAKGQCVNCAACDVRLEASVGDQAYMTKYMDRQANYGKSMLVFCLLWFANNFLVLIIYGSQEAGLMSIAGIVIAAGINCSKDEPAFFDLEVAAGD
ncbi:MULTISPECIES: hypothetical protein [Pseudomonas]|uniref:hypothetical protein n=1 Tax=Pseudomonas TaxID=286 RepID=UPI00242ABCE1|nr:hypothetical protein [Pseudomonas helleri]